MSASAQKMKLKCSKKRLKRKREHCDAGQLEAQSGKALFPHASTQGQFRYIKPFAQFTTSYQ